MANYNRIKSAKAVPIGTIMPWTGSSSQSAVVEDGIPFGYVVCRGQSLRAIDYPLLAQLLGNTYGPFQEPGGPLVGIQNAYPNYDENDIFILPNLNNCAMVDIEASRISPEDAAVVGEYITENGNDAAPLSLITSYVDVNFAVEGDTQLSGKMTGITLGDPAFFDTYRTIPRKLGIDHTPGHTHPRPPGANGESGSYPSSSLAGTFVATFMPGNYDTQDNEWTTADPVGVGTNEDTADRFEPGEVLLTWYDEVANSLVTCDQFNDFTAASQVIPQARSASSPRTIPAFGQTENSYEDDYSCVPNENVPAYSGPFPAPGTYNGYDNFYRSSNVAPARRGGPYATTLNHNADAWTSTALASHNHFTIDLTMTKGQMRIPSTTLINNMTTGTIAPVSVDKALSVQINPNTPSLTTLVIMRAY